ncbi:MAG: heme lyase CcmF/NrfE family subunit [Gammaproteobacteria bacterium]|nr:heme lyase CcmF/NrfE family subunit [Gammaproteobacteria bacterium]
MISELGHFALMLALGLALVQAGAPLIGYRRRQPRWLATAVSAAQAQFLAVVVAYACLTYAFVTCDFSVAYVAANDHTQLPLAYRISAVWGAHEGSLLLWVTVLAIWTLAVSLFNRRLPREIGALVLGVLGLISIGFLLFMLLTSDPFVRAYPVPAEGHGLNPVLQDPGLAMHPPMLYMGYVGFSVAFAFAIAALISGRLDTAWARWTRPWTTAAWMFLTLGITLGSWWAYNELGWGGWWFWDPVENASFMPWLAGTALVHSLAVTEKRGLLKSWTVLLAILTFSLSLLGTFLVRSGVLVSVHAFAEDPSRGLFVLCFLGVVVGTALLLFAWRAPKLVTEGEVRLVSREGLLLLNNAFLAACAGAVLLGTLYPLVIDALQLGKISVGPPYFNAVFAPLFVPLIVLVGFAAVLGWKRGRLRESLRRLRWPAAVAVLIAALLPLALVHRNTLAVAAGCLLGAWALATALAEIVRRLRGREWLPALAATSRSIWGMTAAHAGLGLWAIGVALALGFSAERDLRLAPGAMVNVAGYQFAFQGTEQVQGPNYSAQRGSVLVSYNGETIAQLHPEKRNYPAAGQVMTESAVSWNLARDLYVSLGSGYDDGSWSLRLYVKPGVRLIWLGGVLMFCGGLLAISDRRYRLAMRATAAVADEAVAA